MDKYSTDELTKILWNYNNISKPVKKCDCILVLCSNDIRVAHRGAELFLQGYASLIIFSDNVGRLTEGLWDRPEAQVFAEEAMKLGVPKDKILIEDRSTNTGENILFTKKLLLGKKIKINSFIVVQKPYMLRRAYAAFKKIWEDVEIIMTAPQISFEEYPNEVLSKDDVINIVVGDTQRIKLYPQIGYVIPQKMPNKVWQAYKELVKKGYTKHLVKEE